MDTDGFCETEDVRKYLTAVSEIIEDLKNGELLEEEIDWEELEI